VLEDVAALGRGDRGVDGRGDGSDLGEREVEQRPFEPGSGEHAEGIALADAEREEAVCELVHRQRGLGP